MQTDLLLELNDVQKKAVETNHCAELIVAGAGSGKTRVITYKIAYLIEQKIAQSDEITALTFTNKAAKEMKIRIKDLLLNRGLNNVDTSFLTIATFHSFAANILRANASLLGYSSNFTIYDQGDQKQLITTLMKHLEMDTKKYQPKNIITGLARFATWPMRWRSPR